MHAQVDVYKPVTSKAVNSETYITCWGFRGIEEATLYSLLSHISTKTFDDHAMIPLQALPDSFLQSCVDCGKHFSQSTMEWIQDAYQLLNRTRDHNLILDDTKIECVKQWFKSFRPMELDPSLRLVPVRIICDPHQTKAHFVMSFV